MRASALQISYDGNSYEFKLKMARLTGSTVDRISVRWLLPQPGKVCSLTANHASSYGDVGRAAM